MKASTKDTSFALECFLFALCNILGGGGFGLRFQAIQHSVRVLQQRWRETLTARKQRAEFLRIRKSVVVLQALWRAARVRRSIERVIVFNSILRFCV